MKRVILLGVDRLGMIPHLAKVLSNLGCDDIIGLVNDPDLIRPLVRNIPQVKLTRVANPFDAVELATVAATLGAGEPDHIMLCVQDRLAFGYLAACEHLSLNPSIHCLPLEGIRRARLKPIARMLWARSRVDDTQWTVLCEDESRTQEWEAISRVHQSDSHQYIVKPVAGVASEAVFRAYGWKDVLRKAAHVREHLQNSRERRLSSEQFSECEGLNIALFSDVLVEQLHEGAEFTVDGCIIDGQVTCIVQHKETRWTGEFFGDGLIVSPPDPTWDPRDASVFAGYTASPVVSAKHCEFEQLMQQGLGALSIDNWVFHAEVIETQNGLRFIELNPRGAGGLLWETAGRRLGSDPFEILARICLGTRLQVRPTTGIVTGQFPVYALRLGVATATGIERAKTIPGVVKVQLVADKVTVTDTEKENYIAFVHLEGATHEEVRASAMAAFETIQVEYSE